MGIADWFKKPQTETSPLGGREQLEAAVIAALRQVFDPEIPVNIYDLGLIYELDVASDGDVDIRMTLTAPGCGMHVAFRLAA